MNVLSFEYDTSYHPAAPCVEIEIYGYDASLGTRSIWAMVDSGADATILPVSLLNAIGADYKETAWMSGTAGGRIEVDLYSANVRIGPITTNGVHVIATADANEAIIGRDVLNQLVVTLNGHAQMTEVLLD